jgi:hypothetical protein
MARMPWTTPHATGTSRVSRMVMIAGIVAAAVVLFLMAFSAGANLLGVAVQETPSVVVQPTEPIYFPGRPF